MKSVRVAPSLATLEDGGQAKEPPAAAGRTAGITTSAAAGSKFPLLTRLAAVCARVGKNKAGNDVGGTCGTCSTLIQAAELGRLERFRELLAQGQKIETGDFPYLYDSPLYAAYGGQAQILHFLVEHAYALHGGSGSEERVREQVSHWLVDDHCWMGKTVCHVIAWQGHILPMLYLIALDMDETKLLNKDMFAQKDLWGKLPLDWAASQGHTDVLELMIVYHFIKTLPPEEWDPSKKESLVRKTRQKLLKFLFTSKLSARDAHEVLGSLADALGAQDEEQLVAQELRQEQGAQQEQEEQERASLIKTAADLPGTPQSPSPRSQGEPGPAWAAGREPLASGSGVPPAATAAARARSSFVRGAETTEMQHITEELLWDVLTAHCACGVNPMKVVQFLKDIFTRAAVFEQLQNKCEEWLATLLDICDNKHEVQVLLTPTRHDQPLDERLGLSRPIAFALETGDKTFLTHRYVQELFHERWDIMGIMDLMTSPLSGLFCAAAIVVMYTCWVATLPFIVVLRSFFSPMEAFMQRGRVLVDSRFPWHVPLYKWVIFQCTQFVLVGLIVWQVLHRSDYDRITPVEIVTAVWCFAIIVDEALEFYEGGMASYMSEGWNALDLGMGVCYLAYFFIQVAESQQPAPEDASDQMNQLLLANDFLAVAAVLIISRTASVFELSASMGPLIQMIKTMITRDLSRFILLVFIIVMGFSVGIMALFQPVCVTTSSGTQECQEFSSWGYDWQAHGLTGALRYMQYVTFGGVPVTDLEQKRVTGIIFFTVFNLILSILALNLLIAMLADTYTTVQSKATIEFRFRKARLMWSFYSREAIMPPLSLLHLICGFAGNTLRRAMGWRPVRAVQVGHSTTHQHQPQVSWWRSDYLPVVLSRSDESQQDFKWYNPQDPKEERQVLRHRQAITERFMSKVGLDNLKRTLTESLPIVMSRLAEKQVLFSAEGLDAAKLARA